MLHGEEASVLPASADSAIYAPALTIDGPLVMLMCILLGSMLERHFKVLDVLASSSEARRLVCSTAVALLTGMSVASVTLTAVVGTAAANSSQLAGCAATAIKFAQLTFVSASQRANEQQQQQQFGKQQQEQKQQQQQQRRKCKFIEWNVNVSAWMFMWVLVSQASATCFGRAQTYTLVMLLQNLQLARGQRSRHA